MLVAVLHSSNFGATRYRDVLKALFKPAAVEARGKGVRVGFLLAVGGEVQKNPSVEFTDPKPDLSALDRLGLRPEGVAEQLSQIAPAVAARFDPKVKAARRVVLLASARSAPPNDTAEWKDTAIDAVLVADDTRPDAERVLAWHRFAGVRGGSVTVLLADPAGKPEALVSLVDAHLRRLVRPVPAGDK